METLKRICRRLIAPESVRWWVTAFDILFFITLFLFISGALVIVSNPLIENVPDEGSLSFFGWHLVTELFLLLACLCAAWIVFHIRKIPLSVLGISFRFKDWMEGMLLALLLYGIGFSLSLWSGAVEVSSVNFRPLTLCLSLCFFLLVGVTEELMLRGFVLGRMLYGGAGKTVALFLSSLLFSLFHLFNPNFAFLPFLNILLAGILLGIPYLYTRNLSLSISLHCFWNWLQGPVLGYSISGNEFSGYMYGESLFTLRQIGPEVLSGGTFGFEGSLVCTAMLAFGSALLFLRYGKGKYRLIPRE